MGLMLKHTFKETAGLAEGKVTDKGVEFVMMALPRRMEFCFSPQVVQQIMTFANSKGILG